MQRQQKWRENVFKTYCKLRRDLSKTLTPLLTKSIGNGIGQTTLLNIKALKMTDEVTKDILKQSSFLR